MKLHELADRAIVALNTVSKGRGIREIGNGKQADPASVSHLSFGKRLHKRETMGLTSC